MTDVYSQNFEWSLLIVVHSSHMYHHPMKQILINKTSTSSGQIDITDASYDGTSGGIIVSGSASGTVPMTGGQGERMVLLCNGLNWFVM